MRKGEVRSRQSRYLRLPYFYLPTATVSILYRNSITALRAIYAVRNDIPDMNWSLPEVKEYLYHPIFLTWVYKKSFNELIRRSWKPKKILSDDLLLMPSRSIAGFLPPKDADLAADVVWCLESWRKRLLPGGEKLPLSYVNLAKKYYGYSPQEAACERVEQSEGRHRDADREWYLS